MLDTRDWIALALAPGIGPACWGALMRGELDAEASDRSLAEAHRRVPARHVDALLRSTRRIGAELLPPTHPAWPERLRVLPDPPALLHARGDAGLLGAPQLAVVGARRASRRAILDARWLVGDLVAAGLVITSGLALGVDGAAHEAALAAGGRTVAVLGSGLDRPHPRRHRGLADAVAADGLLLSEFPPGTPPLPAHFPRRNRIISGLALGVLVVEAGERSGSMITARLAAAQGRDVFAVPSVPRDAGAAGCLRLLREGAVLVRDAGDVLEELGLESMAIAAAEPTTPLPELPEPLRRVHRLLDPRGSDFEGLLRSSGLDAATLAGLLTELELEGLVIRDGERLLPCVAVGRAGDPVP